MNKKGELPLTEIIAIIIAIIILVAIILILIVFSGGGFSVSQELWSVVSFSWLFGNG